MVVTPVNVAAVVAVMDVVVTQQTAALNKRNLHLLTFPNDTIFVVILK